VASRFSLDHQRYMKERPAGRDAQREVEKRAARSLAFDDAGSWGEIVATCRELEVEGVGSHPNGSSVSVEAIGISVMAGCISSPNAQAFLARAISAATHVR
jgi:hypothetical protein